MWIIAFIESPDVIKKILKHLGLWDVKRKPRPTANAPPIDVFPTYDEQPSPSIDDYIRDPDLCASGALPCRGLFLRSRAVAGSEGEKTTHGQLGFLCLKSRIFIQFIAKFRLDNMIFMMYLDTYCRESVGNYCYISDAQYVVTFPQPVHNFSFSLNSLSKSEFLSFH